MTASKYCKHKQNWARMRRHWTKWSQQGTNKPVKSAKDHHSQQKLEVGWWGDITADRVARGVKSDKLTIPHSIVNSKIRTMLQMLLMVTSKLRWVKAEKRSTYCTMATWCDIALPWFALIQIDIPKEQRQIEIYSAAQTSGDLKQLL